MKPHEAAAVIIDKLGAMQLKAADDEEFVEMVTDETWDMRNELGLRDDTNWSYAVEDAIRELLGIEHTLRGADLVHFKQATATRESTARLSRNGLRQLIKEELYKLTEGAAKPPDIERYLKLHGLTIGTDYEIAGDGVSEDYSIIGVDDQVANEIFMAMEDGTGGDPPMYVDEDGLPENPLAGSRYTVQQGDRDIYWTTG